jgi:hypothetical protein
MFREKDGIRRHRDFPTLPGFRDNQEQTPEPGSL